MLSVFLPEIFAKAAVNCTEKLIIELEGRGQTYIDFIWTKNDDAARQKELRTPEEKSVKIMIEAKGSNESPASVVMKRGYCFK